jgi:uncharacterized protein (TIGR02301 family)
MPAAGRISAAKVEPSALKKRLAPNLVALGLMLCCLSRPAAVSAQTPAPPPPASENATAPYDGDLQRLAEILGSLQYLRTVCGAKEGQKWRAEMQALIDAEAPGGERKRRIVARFNSGYRGFEQTYRTCTPAADLAIRRYLDEGAKIAREITARYAN